MRHLIEDAPLIPKYNPHDFMQFTPNIIFISKRNYDIAKKEIEAAEKYVRDKSKQDLQTYAGLRKFENELKDPELASVLKFQKLLKAVSDKAWPQLLVPLSKFNGLHAHWLVYYSQYLPHMLY
jgi:hypothetical protein